MKFIVNASLGKSLCHKMKSHACVECDSESVDCNKSVNLGSRQSADCFFFCPKDFKLRLPFPKSSDRFAFVTLESYLEGAHGQPITHSLLGVLQRYLDDVAAMKNSPYFGAPVRIFLSSCATMANDLQALRHSSDVKTAGAFTWHWSRLRHKASRHCNGVHVGKYCTSMQWRIGDDVMIANAVASWSLRHDQQWWACP